jgi:hypothetical protein
MYQTKRIKKRILFFAFIPALLLSVAICQQFNIAEAADPKPTEPGFFKGEPRQKYDGHSVLPNGMYQDTAEGVISTIKGYLNGSGPGKMGASFVVCTMMGLNNGEGGCHSSLSASDPLVAEWADIVTWYGEQGLIRKVAQFSYTRNSLYEPSTDDVHLYNYHDMPILPATVFYDPNNPDEEQYAIKQDCGNPVGKLEPIVKKAFDGKATGPNPRTIQVGGSIWFRHEMIRYGNDVAAKSDWTVSGAFAGHNGQIVQGTFTSPSADTWSTVSYMGGRIATTDDIGKTYCQTLTFDTGEKQANNDPLIETRKYCVDVEGPTSSQCPSGMRSGSSFIEHSFRINGVNADPNSFAKPGDDIYLRYFACNGAQNVRDDHGNWGTVGCTMKSTSSPNTSSDLNINDSNCGLPRGGTWERIKSYMVKGTPGLDLGQTFTQNFNYTGATYASANYPHYSNWCQHRYSGHWLHGPDYMGLTQTFANPKANLTLKVPYNYKINTNISSSSQYPAIADAGASMVVNFSFDVVKRQNVPSDSQGKLAGQTYATATKKTKWQLTKFIANRGTNAVNYGHNVINSSAPCAYFPHRGDCNVAQQSGSSISGNGVYNNDPSATTATAIAKQLAGTTGVVIDERGFYIDDEEPGTEICYALSVYPASSHDNGSSGSMNDSMSGNWIHSQPVCRTVAKRPKVAVTGAGLYTGGEVITNQTTKTNPDGSATPNTTRTLLGSWSEYEIIAGKPVAIGNARGMSSSAAFARSFTPLNTSIPNIASTTIGHLYSVGSAAAAQHTNPASPSSPKTLNYSRLTLSNNNADSGNLGNILGFGKTGAIEPLVNRLQEWAGSSSCSSTQSPASSVKCRYNGNLVVSGATIGSKNTSIINVNGDVLITGNIVYHNGSYTNISSLPQVIIIAKNIYISPDVTRVDSWLIARGDRDASGTYTGNGGLLSTCAIDSSSFKSQPFYNSSGARQMSIDVCGKYRNVETQVAGSAKTYGLVVNGPVIVDKLDLMRTAGANTANKSSDPAEVFNLRADTYLWLYYQIQRTHSAQTTFTQEMPPRL